MRKDHARSIVDPRVELVFALEALTKGNPCSQDEGSGYLDRIKKTLPADHPACVRFAKMSESDWRHRHPSLIVLDLSDPPELTPIVFFEHYKNNPDDPIAQLLPDLRDFARDHFLPFFRSEQVFYETWLAPLERAMKKMDYLGPLEDYLGLSLPHRYDFIFTPLLHGDSPHNTLYRRPDGSFDIYTISGHRAIKGGLPDFGYAEGLFEDTAWHEVCHTVIDDITRSFKARVDPLEPLYGLMTATAKNKYSGPPGWSHMIDEHVIRAVTCRLTALSRGEEEGEKALAREKKEGFALIGPVHGALLEYEKERTRYPSIGDFYPRLFDVLDEVDRRVKGRRGGA